MSDVWRSNAFCAIWTLAPISRVFFHHFAQKWVPTRGFQSEAKKKRPKIFGTLGWSMASASSVSFSNFCSTALTWPRKKQPPSIVLVDLIGI
jgi:hypothetical protein